MVFQGATSPPKLFTLIFLTGVSVLSLNMFLPSLVNIAADFDTDYAFVNLSIAGYLAVTAILQIIIGPLSDRFGRRPVLLGAILLFTLASLGCLLSQNIWSFLGFRMIQGAIIAGAALSQAVIRDTLPVNQAASRLGYVSMAMAIVPMIGPIIGGLLAELFGWRSDFLLFAVLGALLLGLCWVDLGETNNTPSQTFARQFRSYPALFGSRRFWGYGLCTAFSTGAFFAFLAGAPLVGQTLFAMSPGLLGVYLGSITGGFFCGSFLSARLVTRYSLTATMIAGRIVACLGLVLGLVLLFAGLVHAYSYFGAIVFVGVGNGITMPSSRIGAMSVCPDLAGSASGLSGALTVGVGAILTSVTGVVVAGDAAAPALLGIMLAVSFLGLLASVYVRQQER